MLILNGFISLDFFGFSFFLRRGSLERKKTQRKRFKRRKSQDFSLSSSKCFLFSFLLFFPFRSIPKVGPWFFNYIPSKRRKLEESKEREERDERGGDGKEEKERER